MTQVPWLRLAAPYRDREIAKLTGTDYSKLRLRIGTSSIKVPTTLQAIGCSAMLLVTEGRRGVLTVCVAVRGPDHTAMSVDGFKVTPKGRITPLYPDGYDD